MVLSTVNKLKRPEVRSIADVSQIDKEIVAHTPVSPPRNSDFQRWPCRDESERKSNFKINEVDYYRKAQRVMLYCQRGSPEDQAALRRSLQTDFKRHMYDISDPRHLINRADPTGDTPLFAAARNGNESIVLILLELGANPFIECHNQSLLEVTSRW